MAAPRWPPPGMSSAVRDLARGCPAWRRDQGTWWWAPPFCPNCVILETQHLPQRLLGDRLRRSPYNQIRVVGFGGSRNKLVDLSRSYLILLK